jgi:hypothetical protein
MEQSLRNLMDCLLTDHDIHPETVSTLFYTRFRPNIPCVSEGFLSRLDDLGDKNAKVSLWHRILLTCYYVQCEARSGSESKAQTLRGRGIIVEKFLEYGADPYFEVSITNSPFLGMGIVVRVQGELQHLWLATYSGGDRGGVEEYPNAGFPTRAPYEGKNMSLADLVERWDLPNKKRILELIKRNMLMLGGANDNKGSSPQMDEPLEEMESANLTMVDVATEKYSEVLPSKPTSNDLGTALDGGSGKDDLAGVKGFNILKLLTTSAALSFGALIGECNMLI